MEKIYEFENYLPVPLLIMISLLAFLSSMYFTIFIVFYILVGLVLVINSWRMHEKKVENRKILNSYYYWAYGIIIFLTMIHWLQMISDGNVV